MVAPRYVRRGVWFYATDAKKEWKAYGEQERNELEKCFEAG